MTEHDAFETRLHDAFGRYVEAGPTEFDAAGFASTVAAAEPRRQARGLALAWRLTGMPRLAWILLVSVLLTALLGSLMFLGTQRHQERVHRAWQQVSVPGGGQINDVIQTPTGFLAVGGKTGVAGEGSAAAWTSTAAAWTSPDCLNWTLVPSDDVFRDGYLEAVAQGGPGFVAVGTIVEGNSNRLAIWTTLDGVTWTQVPSGQLLAGSVLLSGRMLDIESYGGRLVAVGQDELAIPAIWTSRDGERWDRIQSIDPAPRSLGWSPWGPRDIATGGPGLVAVGNSRGNTRTGEVVWASSDGLAWKQVSTEPQMSGGQLSQVAKGPGGVLVAVGGRPKTPGSSLDDLSPTVWYSADGFEWTTDVDLSPFTSTVLAGPWPSGWPPQPEQKALPAPYAATSAVAAAGGRFIIVGNEGQRYVGTVGNAGYSFDQTVRGVLWTSADGRAWAREASDPVFEDARLTKVFPCGDKLLVTGTYERGDSAVPAAWVRPIDSSEPPTQERLPGAWQRVVFPAAGSVNDVIQTPIGVLAVGMAGAGTGQAAVWTSPDCVSWTLEPAIDASPDAEIRAIARGGPGYVAVGFRTPSNSDLIPTVWTSPEGRAWTRVPDDQLLTESGFSVGDFIDDLESLDGRLVAQGWSQKAGLQAFWISDDGVQWNRVESFDRFGVNYTGWGPYPLAMTTGGPGLVAVGVGRNPDLIEPIGEAAWWSSDGLTWTPASADARKADNRLEGVAAGPDGTLVAIGTTGAEDGAVVRHSADGLSWSAATDMTPFEPAASPTSWPSAWATPSESPLPYVRSWAVTAAGGGFIIVGEEGSGSFARQPARGVVWTSPDASTWTREAADPTFEGARLSDVHPCGDKLLVTGTYQQGGQVVAAWVRPIDAFGPPTQVQPTPTPSTQVLPTLTPRLPTPAATTGVAGARTSWPRHEPARLRRRPPAHRARIPTSPDRRTSPVPPEM